MMIAADPSIQFRIRKATRSDISELVRLRWDSRAEEQAGHSRTIFFRECAAWLHEALASGRWIVAVAEAEHIKLIGCMYLQCVTKVPVPGQSQRSWGYITNAFVEADKRAHGTGKQLLNFLIEAAKNRALEFLIVWPSDEAVTFYKRAGFQSVEVAHNRADDQPPLEMML
jgi:GNAT superfamily N-acetyltransferase